jgi:hypothetical protein
LREGGFKEFKKQLLNKVKGSEYDLEKYIDSVRFCIYSTRLAKNKLKNTSKRTRSRMKGRTMRVIPQFLKNQKTKGRLLPNLQRYSFEESVCAHKTKRDHSEDCKFDQEEYFSQSTNIFE